MPTTTTTVNYRQHQALDTDPAYPLACKTFMLSPGQTRVLFSKAAQDEHWQNILDAPQDPAGYNTFEQDIITVSARQDAFGSWFEIAIHGCPGSENLHALSPIRQGVAFIDGELYELHDMAIEHGELFEPCWSPVCHAHTAEHAAIFHALTGKAYPVMQCDSTNAIALNQLKKLKEQAGFLYDPKGDTFHHTTQYHFDNNLHQQIYLSLSNTDRQIKTQDLLESLTRVADQWMLKASSWLQTPELQQDLQQILSRWHNIPHNELALAVKDRLDAENQRQQDLKREAAALERHNPEAPALHFYHGGKPWFGKFELNAKKSGGMEHGPGLYLTNGVQTAQSYAKGGGVVNLIKVRPDARLLGNTTSHIDTMIDFINRHRIRNGKRVIASLRSASERYQKQDLSLESLINLMINHDALTPATAQPLSEFIVSQGVDMNVFKAPMWCSHGEGNDQWVVIFNPEVIMSRSTVDMKQFDWSEPRLPTYEEQLAWLQRHAQPESKPDAAHVTMTQRRAR